MSILFSNYPMNFHFPSPALIFALLIFLFMVIKIGWRNKTQNQGPKLPPGPWKLPIIGNLHQLLGPLPHHTLRDLAKKHGPLMHLRLGEVSTIVVSSPKLAKVAMMTHDLNFADRPWALSAEIVGYGGINMTFSPYGQHWRQMRKTCMLGLLSSKRVNSFQLIREEEASNLIQSISSATSNLPINLTQKLFSWSNNIIARATFGNKIKDQERFISRLRKLMKLAGGLSIADCFPSSQLAQVITGLRFQYESVRKEFDEIFDDIIEEHKQGSINMENSEGRWEEANLLDVIWALQQQGDLEQITNDCVKAIILDMFIGGTESTSTLMEWVMAELMRNPRIMEKAQAEVRRVFGKKEKLDWRDTNELEYSKSVLKETLRLHPPGPILVPRECREKCEIEGYEIPIKTRIIINAWAIGTDPQHWDDPESFKPERFYGNPIDYKGTNFEFIPFGAGRRACPGITFAETNALLLLSQLLYFFDWKLPNGMEPQDLDMTEEFGLTVHRRSELYLLPIPHFPSKTV
eukprot:TRINITY_DN5764_c0_g1_i1.p1 TRINITY_DN5764_c0_g1~~TRINITY_DN5764_c0_g1_i1.p1  ORF type:complete len:519 (-),score=82.86 TRINITY_DN5764_c0_g1_i1:301-1857(-)